MAALEDEPDELVLHVPDELVLHLKDPLMGVAGVLVLVATGVFAYFAAGYAQQLGLPFFFSITGLRIGQWFGFGIMLVLWIAVVTAYLLLRRKRRTQTT